MKSKFISYKLLLRLFILCNLFHLNYFLETECSDKIIVDRTIIAVGSRGVGKSTFCNALTKSNIFKTGYSFESVTKAIQSETVKINYSDKITLNLKVIDVPGLFDPNQKNLDLIDIILNTIKQNNVNHVILVVKEQMRNQREDKAMQEILKYSLNQNNDMLSVVVNFREQKAIQMDFENEQYIESDSNQNQDYLLNLENLFKNNTIYKVSPHDQLKSILDISKNIVQKVVNIDTQLNQITSFKETLEQNKKPILQTEQEIKTTQSEIVSIQENHEKKINEMQEEIQNYEQEIEKQNLEKNHIIKYNEESKNTAFEERSKENETYMWQVFYNPYALYKLIYNVFYDPVYDVKSYAEVDQSIYEYKQSISQRNNEILSQDNEVKEKEQSLLTRLQQLNEQKLKLFEKYNTFINLFSEILGENLELK